MTPAVVVSISALCVSLAALGFTVFSFWIMNARRGKLRTYRPHSFAAYLKPNELALTLPLVIHNGGAAPIVVQDLRLHLHGNIQGKPEAGSPGHSPTPLQLWWRGTRPELEPSNNPLSMPAAFPVAGRQAMRMFIEFGVLKPAYVPSGGPCVAVVEAKLGHRDGWVDVLTFDLHTEQMKDKTAGHIAYSNDPDWQA